MVIHTGAESERFLGALEALYEVARLSLEKQRLAELFTLATPREVSRELMSAHSLRQADLIDVFGSESIGSEVLSGKRELAKAQIQRLSVRLPVSPVVFFMV